MPEFLRSWRPTPATKRADPARIARLERELGIGDDPSTVGGHKCLIAGWGNLLNSSDVDVDEYGRVSLTSATGSHGLGSITPETGGYRIQIDMGFHTIGSSLALHSGLYFGRGSADPYEFGAPNTAPGYHLVMRQNGHMRLFRHSSGITAGFALGVDDVHTAAPKAGEPMTFEIDVTPTTIEARRLGNPSWTTGPIDDAAHRGGHFGLSNGSIDNSAARPFWDYLVVTEL